MSWLLEALREDNQNEGRPEGVFQRDISLPTVRPTNPHQSTIDSLEEAMKNEMLSLVVEITKVVSKKAQPQVLEAIQKAYEIGYRDGNETKDAPA